jgi:hypothetical protein
MGISVCFQEGQSFLSLAVISEQFWNPLSLLYNGYDWGCWGGGAFFHKGFKVAVV